MIVEDKQEFLEQLQAAVSLSHNCPATHSKTVSVHETFRGETVWEGDVEVYDLHGHPKASTAYAWIHREGDHDQRTSFVTILGIPPVVSAETAIRAQIVKDIEKAR